MRNPLLFLGILTLGSPYALAACGSSVDTVAPLVARDAGPDTGSPELVTQSGTVVDFQSQQPIVGATVAAAGETATTDATGTYSFTVQAGVPYTVTASAPGYGTMVQEERSIEADEADGKMNLVSTAQSSLLAEALDGYDANLGVLSVGLFPTGSCASADGATISVSPPGAARVTYWMNGAPSPSQTSVHFDTFPAAIVYNVQPGVPLTLTVTSPTCTQVPFPTVQGPIRYTGRGIEAQADGASTYVALFLQ